MRRLIAVTAALAMACGGCSQQDGDWRADAKFLREAGFKGKATIIYGGGHIAGQAFNLSGSSGVIEIQIDPADGHAPTD